MRLWLQPGQTRALQNRDSLERREIFYSTADGKRSYFFSLHFKQHKHRNNQPSNFPMDSTRVGFAVLWLGTDRKDRRDQRKSSTDTFCNILTQDLCRAEYNCNWNCATKTKIILYYLRHFNTFFSSSPTSPTPPLHPMDFEYLLNQVFFNQVCLYQCFLFSHHQGSARRGMH